MSVAKRLLLVAVLCALAPAALIPTAAVAQGDRSLSASTTASTAAADATRTVTAVSARSARAQAREARIASRITAALQRRKGRFDATSTRIQTRITTVAELADKVAGAGGDVVTTTSALGSAHQHMNAAAQLEAQAVAAFNAVPTAADRLAAFAAARKIARSAAAELAAARKDLRHAVVTLRATVNGLRTSASAATGSN